MGSARRTKIIATMGPAAAAAGTVEGMVGAGMDVARLNFSHGDHDFHRHMAERVREAARAAGRPVALLQDIQGPKIRVGTFPGGSVLLKEGDRVRLAYGEGESPPGTLHIGYPRLASDLKPGDRVILADGLIQGMVDDSPGDDPILEIHKGGELSDRKGAAFPDSRLTVAALTDQDREDLLFGRTLGVDYVAASFVRTGEDVAKVAELAGGDTPVIAKVELAAAYQNLDSILQAAYGVMVARGDLGVQLPLETIPHVQADILRRTNQAGLVSITATEMLESMVSSLRPSRAEVTDVATAVASYTDAVMLSAETAVGDNPALAIEAMSSICREAERHRDLHPAPQEVGFLESRQNFASAMAKAATEAARNLGFQTIVAFTESGGTAELLSKYRPSAQIMAFAADPRIRRRMALFWGVAPIEYEPRPSTDLMFAAAEKYLEKEGICQRGEGVVMVAGSPPNVGAFTNLIKLHVVGERLRSVRTPGVRT